MYPFYDVLLVPLYIFAFLLCLFVQMLQQSTLEPIGVAPNIFSLILGIRIVIFCYFFLLYIARFLIQIDAVGLKLACAHDLGSHFH